jgi:transcriptional regulator with XRE-family HTH domain
VVQIFILSQNRTVPLNRIQISQLRKLGANVHHLREQQCLTQERLAEMVALHPRTLQKIEAGEFNMLISTLYRLQRALRCRWEELLGKS